MMTKRYVEGVMADIEAPWVAIGDPNEADPCQIEAALILLTGTLGDGKVQITGFEFADPEDRYRTIIGDRAVLIRSGGHVAYLSVYAAWAFAQSAPTNMNGEKAAVCLEDVVDELVRRSGEVHPRDTEAGRKVAARQKARVDAELSAVDVSGLFGGRS